MGAGILKIEKIPVGFLRTNCYIVSDCAKNAVVIDPGDEAGRILNFLSDNRLKCETVLLTHGHFDHIGAVAEIVENTRAALAMNKLDLESVNRDIDIELEEGTILRVGEMELLSIAAPGHTPGGMCYLTGDVLFTGDTLFRGNIGRTDLPGGDYEAIRRSLKKLAELDYDDLRILPGHMEETTLEYERENNFYLK